MMNERTQFLPYGRHTIEDDDVAAVMAALRSDFLTTGPLVDAYEDEFARITDAAYAVACNSGTAALHLSVLAMEIGPGDAVIVPTMTFLATANVVRMTGADVVFADVDAESGLMTPDNLDEALKRTPHRVRAVVPVHLNGQVCAMESLSTVAERRGAFLIEDACHALGVPSIGAARYSKLACFSTHPVKAIATAEGGMVTTADEGLAKRMRRLRNHGMTRNSTEFVNTELAFDNGVANPWYYEMPEVGWNYRLPDVLCALGLSQIKKLERFWHHRSKLATLYDRLLAPLAPALRPVSRKEQAHGWHLYAVRIDFSQIDKTRAQVMAELRRFGVGSQVHYIPVHSQPYYRELLGTVELPGADAYYARCLSLPLFPTMSEDDVAHVAGALSRVVLGRG